MQLCLFINNLAFWLFNCVYEDRAKVYPGCYHGCTGTFNFGVEIPGIKERRRPYQFLNTGSLTFWRFALLHPRLRIPAKPITIRADGDHHSGITDL